MENYDGLLRAIREARCVCLSSHLNPDGDNIGSLLGLGLALETLGKEVLIVNTDPTPEQYRFLTGAEKIFPPDRLQSTPDLAIIVDCSDLDRVGTELSSKLNRIPIIVNIDHHVCNTFFGQYNLVDESASATAEIILRLLTSLGVTMNSDIAEALYTGVVMDTGSFQYANTTAKTHQNAAFLLAQGVDLPKISQALFQARPLVILDLIRASLHTLQVSRDGQIAWLTVTRAMLNQTGTKDEHCEELINYPRSIRGVEIALLFRELESGNIKVGFRSKKWADVNKLAGLFGGGGHHHAAGCTFEGTVEKAVEQVTEMTEKYLREQAELGSS